jgi:copper chaperone
MTDTPQGYHEGEEIAMNDIQQTFTVTGMTCGHCVAAVTEEVGALDGVTDVRVDLGTGEVAVVSTRPLERELVAAAVVEAGYELVG